jgi:hypothetical protein
VSDQDFFFDEDETPAAKPAKASKAAAAPAAKRASAPKAAATKPAAAKAAAPAAPSADVVPFAEQTVTVMVAGLLMVIALLVGAIIGFLMAGPSTTISSTVPAATAPTGGSTDVAPGPLTDEQIQGGMPAGHVPVNQDGTASGTPAP